MANRLARCSLEWTCRTCRFFLSEPGVSLRHVTFVLYTWDDLIARSRRKHAVKWMLFTEEAHSFDTLDPKKQKKAGQRKLQMLNASESSAKHQQTSGSQAFVFQDILTCPDGWISAYELVMCLRLTRFGFCDIGFLCCCQRALKIDGAFCKGAPNSDTGLKTAWICIPL